MPLPVSDNGSFTTAKSMQFMKNRNNISRSQLARELTVIEKQKLMNLGELSQNCLDLKSFLRQLKYCGSNETPEAKHWLKVSEKSHRHGILDLFGGVKQSQQEGQGHIETDVLVDEQEDPTAVYRRGAPAADSHMQYISIFSRRSKDKRDNNSHKCSPRNEYGGLAKENNLSYTERRQLALQHHQNNVQFLAHRISGSANTTPIPLRIKSTASDRSMRPKLNQEATVINASTNGQAVPVIKGTDPTTEEDLMKTLLLTSEVCNSRTKQHRKRKVPLKDRITKFFTDIDRMKAEQVVADAAPCSKTMHRQWIALTQGVDAALAESSDDEDEDVMHTI